MWILVVLILSAILGWIFRLTNSLEFSVLSPVYASTAQSTKTRLYPPKIANLPHKVASLQPTAIVEKLILCESGGNLAAVGDNGKARGILQFHKPTLESYARRYGLRENLTEADLTNSSLQRETAIKMIEENPANIKHWYNCSKRLKFI